MNLGISLGYVWKYEATKNIIIIIIIIIIIKYLSFLVSSY